MSGFRYQVLSFILLWVLVSCTPEVVDNTRIVVSGRLVNAMGDAVPEADIEVFVANRNFLLGEGMSGLDGSFEVPSFYSRFERFVIQIDKGSEYSTYQRELNTVNYTPEGFELNLGQIELRRQTSFDLMVERISGEGNEIQLSISYVLPYCFEFFEEPDQEVSNSQCYPLQSRVIALNDDSPNFDASYNAVTSVPVIISYSINNGPDIVQEFNLNEIQEVTISY